MKTKHSLKFALLTASALVATAAPAHAAPTTGVAPVSIEHAVDAADDAAPAVSPVLKKVGLAAMAAGAVAAFLKLIGGDRVQRFAEKAGPATAKAARAVAAAPVAAARAVGRIAARPVRFLLFYAGVALFALAGVGLYHVEWLGGLAAGMALVFLAWLGAAQTRRVFARRSD